MTSPSRADGLRAPSIALAAAVAVIGIRMIVRLPGLPYHLSELFLDQGGALALAIFAVALIWVGAGSMLLAHWLARSRRPYIVLPVGTVIVSMVSRTLLKYSVTYGSLDNILGTNNLFSQVTIEDMWGEFWRHAFLVTNVPDLVSRSLSAGFCWGRVWSNISRSTDLSSQERSFCSVPIVGTPSAARRSSGDGPSCKAER